MIRLLSYYIFKRIIKALYDHASTTTACSTYFHKHFASEANGLEKTRRDWKQLLFPLFRHSLPLKTSH